MNNTFSLQQRSETGNLDSKLISRQYKLNFLCKFMQMKSNEPRITQKQICNQLGFSDSTIKRYRNDKNMLSPYRIQPIITNNRSKKVLNTNIDTNSHREHDHKRPQMTSNDP